MDPSVTCLDAIQEFFECEWALLYPDSGVEFNYQDDEYEGVPDYTMRVDISCAQGSASGSINRRYLVACLQGQADKMNDAFKDCSMVHYWVRTRVAAMFCVVEIIFEPR